MCGFYRPPSSRAEDYLTELNKFLENAERESKLLAIYGDLNLPQINWDLQMALGSDNLSNTFCELINDSFLTQINHSPTRVTGTISNILDLVLTNLPERFHGLSTLECHLNTDHLAVSFFMKTLINRTKVPHLVYNFKRADFVALKEALSCIPVEVTSDYNDDIDQS